MKLNELTSKYNNIVIIAEKPSVKKAVAEVLPGTMKTEGMYIQCGKNIKVCNVRGHILELAQPEAYGASKTWIASELPIIPDKWKYVVKSDSKREFDTVKDLVSKADCIIHAGDPDREGQLLVDVLLQYFKCKLPVYRFLGANNIEHTALIRELDNLIDNKKYESLSKSGKARAYADWIIGMNLTRLYTIILQTKEIEGTANTGRVKTPTMSLVVNREIEIRNFKPVEHYSISGEFTDNITPFKATWKHSQSIIVDAEGRIIDKTIVEKIITKLNNKNSATVISILTDKKEEAHPLPYTLGSLSSKAGKLYGYDPAETLAIVQELYDEPLKILTYPRVDNPYIPESQLPYAKDVLSQISKAHPTIASMTAKANSGYKSRAWNDKKCAKSPHHAIIPTLQPFDFNKLTERQKNIYMLVATAYIAQFYEPHVYNHTKVEIDASGENFTTSGKVTIKAGWRELFGAEDQDDISGEEKNQTLPNLVNGQQIIIKAIDLVTKITKPPKRFTTFTLGEAMEKIHLFLNNKNLKNIMQEKETAGIGTSATRGNIIDQLLGIDVTKKNRPICDAPLLQKIQGKGKKSEDLVPTKKAIELYNILPNELRIPDTTAYWEMEFNNIVDTNADIQPFLDKQAAFLTKIINAGKPLIQAKVIAEADKGPKCPNCETGYFIKRPGKYGEYYSCSNYPDCKTIQSLTGPKEKPIASDHKCPTCKKGNLVKRSGAKGPFYACNQFPKCKATFDVKKIDKQT